MGALLPDLRCGVEVFRRTPWVAVPAALALALGIGAVTVISSTADAVLFRPIPGTSTPNLVRIAGAGDGQLAVLSYPELAALRDASGTFAGVAGERTNVLAVVANGAARTVGAAVVSPTYFDLLGVPTALGRGFEPHETGTVAVVSHAFWQSVWSGDPDVLGRTVSAGGVGFTVVGVAAPSFEGAFPGFRTSVWFPLSQVETVFPDDGDLDRMGDRFLNGVGVLVPGLGPEQAGRRVAQVASALRRDPDFGERRTFQVERARGVHPRLRTPAGALLGALAIVAGAIMLTACANVATLLLERGMARLGDYGTRRLLGARTVDVVRPVVVESLAVALAGTAGGLLCARWVLRVVSGLRPPLDVPLGLELGLAPTVVLAAGAAGVACAAVAGALPAVAAAKVEPLARRIAASRSASAGTGWARTLLVAAQVASTCALLTLAVLLMKGLGGMDRLDVGFDRSSIATVELDVSSMPPEDARTYRESVRQRLLALPEVEAVAGSRFVLLGDRADQREVTAAAAPPDAGPLGPVNYSVVDGSLFSLLDIGIEAGRSFPETLTEADPSEVIVNRVLARRLWPDEDPLGATLRIRDPDGGDRIATVVGVAETVKYREPNEPPTPFFYLPAGQWPVGDQVLHVRVRGGQVGTDVLETLRREVSALDRRVPVVVRRMDAHRRVSTTIAGVLRTVLLWGGAMAWIMAVVGILSVVAYATRARTRELAIRMAVGAAGVRVRRMVVREAARVVIAAAVVGLAVAAAVAAILKSMLYGVSPLDPWVYVGVATGVSLTALGAAWVPTRIATRDLDLVRLLREN